MSWSQRDFEGERGVALFLQRFASSPLVRRSLPNAAAIMSEYFGFKRRPQESISTFLVRETLGFEEFQEALLQLKEERDGLDPASRAFDLPDISPESDAGDWPWYRHRDWRNWNDDDDQADDPGVPDRAEYEPVAQHSNEGSEPRQPDTSPARPSRSDNPRQPESSPAREAPASPTSPPRRPASRHGTVPPPEQAQSGLSVMDTFILDVLRGWRLLVAASLNPDEWRDVLATTGNKLDYLNISNALQTLWDDQLGGNGRWHSGMTTHNQFWSEAQWTEEPWYDPQQAYCN